MPGQEDGFRVTGPFSPSTSGARCKPAKLLLDPYGRAITGNLTWRPTWNGAAADDPNAPDGADSAPDAPGSVDGFTLHDLVSYDVKRNDANQQGNRDGSDDNRSWNSGNGLGDDGPSADAEINALRRRQQRNLLATLLVSRGVPMLLAGDERNRTQQGNNNASARTTRSAGSIGPATPPRTT